MDLVKKTEDRKNSAEMQDYLDFMAKFHHYSYHNSFLIWISNPKATLVKGFRQWNEVNRYVRRGEHGIAILAPMFRKVKKTDEQGKELDEEEEILTYFRVVYVFDVSQTDGEQLPSVDICKAEGNRPILNELIKFASEKGITISFAEMQGQRYGVSSGKKIELDSRLDVMQQSGVAIHEIAHELLHRSAESPQFLSREITREMMETEAETVAYTVAKYFGITLNSETYLSIWQPEPKRILDTFKRIHKTISEIISGVESQQIVVEVDS